MTITGRESSILGVMLSRFTSRERRLEMLKKLGPEAAEIGRGLIGLNTTDRGNVIAARFLAREQRRAAKQASVS